MAAMAVVSGTLARPVKSADGSGILTWEEITGAIHANDAPYYVSLTGLIALENSHNLAGGTVMSRALTEEISERAHKIGVPVHLDGARIFNETSARRSRKRRAAGKRDCRIARR
jgi:threonine aldolase